MLECPACGSRRTRRGGMVIWLIYVTMIALAVPAVLLFHLNSAIVGGIMITIVVIAHLVVNQRVCLDCGRQWRSAAHGRQ